jgi:secreted trypsin-like serine protease
MVAIDSHPEDCVHAKYRHRLRRQGARVAAALARACPWQVRLALPIMLLLVSGCGGEGVTRAPSSATAPAVVALVDRSSPPTDRFAGQFCGGVLVAPRLVLTSARCVTEREPGSIDAVVGAGNLCDVSPATGQRLQVAAVETYEERFAGSAEMDAALLTLSAPASAEPAELPAGPDSRPVSGTAIGWGRSSFGGWAPCWPSAVPLRFSELRSCVTAAVSAGRSILDNRRLCGFPTRAAARNTCSGDSGSPVFGTGASSDAVVALVDWGPGCGLHEPGVYLQTASLVPWVLAVGSASSARLR